MKLKVSEPRNLGFSKEVSAFLPPERLTAKAPEKKNGWKTIHSWGTYHIHWTNEKTDGWNVGRWFKPDIEMLPFLRGTHLRSFSSISNLSVAKRKQNRGSGGRDRFGICFWCTLAVGAWKRRWERFVKRLGLFFLKPGRYLYFKSQKLMAIFDVYYHVT